MKKRMLATLLISILLCSTLAIPALAAADTTPPVLKGLTLSSSKVTAPGSVTATLSATDDVSGIGYASATFYCEELDDYIGCHIEKESDGTFRGALTVNQYQASGVFLLDSVSLYDNAGNYVRYCRQPYGSEKQLSSTLLSRKITVTATNPDITPPQLTNLTLSGTKITAPGSVAVTLAATDDVSGINYASATFYCEELDDYIGCHIEKESDGTFRGALTVNQYQASGVFLLDSVSLYDNAGNYVRYCQQPYGSEKQLSSTLLSRKITVTAANADITPPKLTNLTLSATQIAAPGSITVTLSATDDISGIDYASATFYCEELDDYIGCHIEKESDGTFRGALSVGQYQESGEFLLESVSLYDKAGNYVRYCRQPYGSEKQLSSTLLTRKITVINEDYAAVQKAPYTKSGKTASASVSPIISGNTYQWYIKNAGKTSFSKSSITKATYSATMSSTVKDRQAYCVVTDSSGNQHTTNTVTLRMAATVTTQPKSVKVAENTVAKTSVSAVGDGISYQWYIKNPGASKFSKSSVTSATYSARITAANDGRQIYCVATDKYGNTDKSDTVTLSMAVPVKITTQPQDVAVTEGTTAKTSVKATGDGLSYQWYLKNPGASKFSKSSITAASYSVKMSAASDGRQVYCIVTDRYGNQVRSNTVTLNMRLPLKITSQPENVTAAEGSTVKVSVIATGDGLSYQWYIKNPGAAKFSKSSVTSATYSTKLTAANDGRQIYCIVTDKYGDTLQSDTVTLRTMKTVKITAQPASITVSEGASAKVTVTATGDGLSYQWYVKSPGDSGFSKSSVTAASYSFRMSASGDGRQVYCIVTDTYGNQIQSDTVTLKMYPPVKITVQPKSVTAAENTVVKVTVTASGDGLSYQWYIKNPGSSQFSKSSVTTATYSTKMTAANDGRQVYCTVTDQYGQSVQTDTVTLRIG